MSERILAAPDEAALLYEFDDEEPPRTRPLTQGDVLREVVTIGGATLPLAMIIAHPCSMRSGLKLRKQLAVAEVVPLGEVPPEKWPTTHFDWFPLLGLREVETSVAVSFHRLHTVESAQFEALERVTVLSEYGQMVLLQRWINHMVRLVAEQQEITELIRPVQHELSLQQDWADLALEGATFSDDAARNTRIRELADEFQAFLGHPADEASLRNQLRGKEAAQVDAIKRVRVEMKRRHAAPPAPSGAYAGGA